MITEEALAQLTEITSLLTQFHGRQELRWIADRINTHLEESSISIKIEELEAGIAELKAMVRA